jgi:solute:Na+ symporter, SSS family
VAGLVVASIFAATMSVLSAGFHSLATATVVDFLHRFRRRPSDDARADVATAKWVTLAWAVATTIAALFVAQLGTIVEIFGKISGFFSGTILGVFLLGILSRRTGPTGALLGLAAGTVVTAWLSTTTISWLWYGPAGCAVTVLAGLLTTRIGHAR